MKEQLWRFTDNLGSFASEGAHKIKSLYFPLANEALMSSISPDLHGDIKSGQDAFLMQPVSRIDLVNLRSSRNFWVYTGNGKTWSACGTSKDLKQIKSDKFNLEAGLLWQKVTRENKGVGLAAEILSFVPTGEAPVEIMQVKLTNISSRNIKFTPTAAIPIYGRSAATIRDHRHVTSLLERITPHKFGVIARPALLFNEAGHGINKADYFVLGWDENFRAPQYIYPTQEMFCGESGDLEAPESVLNNSLPKKERIQGKEAMGALRFKPQALKKGRSFTYIILMGISEDRRKISEAMDKFRTPADIQKALERTKKFWIEKSRQADVSTKDTDFDNWFRWVSIQPALRRIFGCSFLPDFDYGKGGRGWRDLWQDCLGLLLASPEEVRGLLVNNFSGVRIDGSNATIIGKSPGEFISDRNNVSRVWMDHGIWPLLTLDLYLNETGDKGILFEKAAYFCDHQIFRSRECNRGWKAEEGRQLKSVSGTIYKGTVLEHLLVQNLVQFFNVGSHNHIRLEDADWNDGLDMAPEFGESVAFSAMYAQNLKILADLLLAIGRGQIEIAEELKILLREVNYNDRRAKNKLLEEYFRKVSSYISGRAAGIDTALLSESLKKKSEWMMRHIREKEWLKEGFFNGYYDNNRQRVEGKKGNSVRMMLASQVFPIMSGVATDAQVEASFRSAQKYLFNQKLKGYHLNTNFKGQQHNLGRAFSFIYGDKENGAYFNHMVVMFAYALYKRGYAKEGWQALESIYKMALNTPASKIYPCLPEYFNLEGRGMYSYLTGSASWFVLTMLTQVFGVRGDNGDLLIEPKLSVKQFKDKPVISVNKVFAGRALRINFSNPRRLDLGRYRIKKATLNSHVLAIDDCRRLRIERRLIMCLAHRQLNRVDIILW